MRQDSYLSALMSSKLAYVPLDEKLQSMQDQKQDESATASAASSSSFPSLVPARSTADTGPTAASNVQMWRGVPFVHCPHNPHLAPTFLLLDWKATEPLSDDEICEFMEMAVSWLKAEVEEAGWQVKPDVWIVKVSSHHSTRVMQRD